MLSDVLQYLRCPVCREALAGGPALRCAAGHSFDVARHGYAYLAAGPPRHPGDSAGMVAAREAFLATGGYAFIAAALAAAAAGRRGLVVDIGAGTGYYVSRVLSALPETVGLAVDVSRPALRRAARAHPRAAAVFADAWQELPVVDGAAAVALNVFAPRNGAELRRVLGPDGLLLVVTPTETHLAELTALAGIRMLRVDPEKPRRVADELAPWFTPAEETVHTGHLSLTRTQLRCLVEMGPSARHTDPAALAGAVAAVGEPFPVTASVRLGRYRLR
jgi:23S rRNA (guanine745-N1)-methyltransferase